jgi:D-alanyl-D-alanine carboxypeptidase
LKSEEIMVKRTVACLLIATAFLGGCSGTPARSGAGNGRASELQALLDRLREEAGAPGAILGVAAGDGPPTIVASGQADREAGTSMTPGAAYFIGSISKTYTAVTVLRLAEDGDLSLDDTVARFLPSFPRGSEITIRHLLEHTSGLKDFYMYLYYRPDRE